MVLLNTVVGKHHEIDTLRRTASREGVSNNRFIISEVRRRYFGKNLIVCLNGVLVSP